MRYPKTNLAAGKIALIAALAASVAISIVIYAHQTTTISNLSSELEEVSQQVEQQNQTIEEYASILEVQGEELAGKTAQLESLQGEINALVREIELQERQLVSRTTQIERLEADLAASNSELISLQQQATNLKGEIATLESEIRAKDRNLAELILANAAARRVHVEHYGLAVDQDGDGIVFPIEIEIIGSGAGRISVDVGNVQYDAAFQEAVRTAAEVASDYTGVTESDKDIIVRLVNESDGLIVVDGPSAGAVIAVMMVAGLEEKQLDPDILVTGAIEPDGMVGMVGGLSDKADAAADYGATTLLVPDGQEFQDSRIDIEGVEDIDELADRIILG